MRIGRIPADPPGEIGLERQGAIVIVERRYYDSESAMQIRVPVGALRQLLDGEDGD